MSKLEPKAFRFEHETVLRIKALCKRYSLNQTEILEKALKELYVKGEGGNNTISVPESGVKIICNTVTIQAKKIVETEVNE